MTHLRTKIIGLVLLLPLLFGVGCDKASAPPAPLSVAELPAALEKAFGKAKPEVKDLASQIVASVQAKDYPKAFTGVQALAAMPAMTKQQMSVVSSALVTVNTLLIEAQAQGDAKAAQAIQHHRATK